MGRLWQDLQADAGWAGCGKMGRRWQDVAGWAESVRLGGDRLGRLEAEQAVSGWAGGVRMGRRCQDGQAVAGWAGCDRLQG